MRLCKGREKEHKRKQVRNGIIKLKLPLRGMSLGGRKLYGNLLRRKENKKGCIYQSGKEGNE